MREKYWLDERRQISKALLLEGIAGEDIAPIAYVLAAIEQLQAKLDNLRWIPVEEGLPKKDGNIVLYKKSKPMVMHYFTNRTSEQWLMGFTHWKPEGERP